MIYLIEIEAFDTVVSAAVVERFATHGYTTRPSDDPPNVHFESRVADPGNYQRSVFEQGRTSGPSSIGYGLIELVNADGGLDRMANYAVDGRRLTILSLPDPRSPWSARQVVLTGTMDQIELEWRKVSIRLRDRSAEFSEPLQPTDYAGTTISGGLNEAEGEDDLKDKPKPTAWGRVFNVSPVLANRFSLIWQVSSRPLSAVDAVRDNGVLLTADVDYPTLTALRAATIPTGRYATCLAAGLIRTQREPAGDLTVDVREGANSQRSAAMTARRVLEFAGFVAGTDFLASDFDALHAANPAEVGWWTGTETADIASVLSALLGSVGAWISPDALGRFRVRRLEAPAFDSATPILDEVVILDGGDGLARLATGDDGKGVPAAKVTVRYARNWTVQTKATLDATNSTPAVRAFAVEEYRNAVAENAAVRTVHLLAKDLTFDTSFAFLADAQAEASRRLAIYGQRRDRYRVPLKAEEASGVTLGDTVMLAIDRFGLDAGKTFVVIGEEVTLATGKIVLDLYG